MLDENETVLVALEGIELAPTTAVCGFSDSPSRRYWVENRGWFMMILERTQEVSSEIMAPAAFLSAEDIHTQHTEQHLKPIMNRNLEALLRWSESALPASPA